MRKSCALLRTPVGKVVVRCSLLRIGAARDDALFSSACCVTWVLFCTDSEGTVPKGR